MDLDFRSMEAYKIFLGEIPTIIGLGTELLSAIDKAGVREAIPEQEMLRYRDPFHRLKGSAGFFGAHEISESARRIEEICLATNLLEHKREISSLLKKIESAFDSLSNSELDKRKCGLLPRGDDG